MFAWMLVSKPCSEATDIGWLLSLGADFGNKNKKVNIGKGRDSPLHLRIYSVTDIIIYIFYIRMYIKE